MANESNTKNQTKGKMSIRSVMGALKSDINIDIDEAIDLAREERAKELSNRSKSVK